MAEMSPLGQSWRAAGAVVIEYNIGQPAAVSEWDKTAAAASSQGYILAIAD